MNTFSARAFYQLGGLLSIIDFTGDRWGHGQPEYHLIDTEVEQLRESLGRALHAAGSVGLKITPLLLKEAIDEIFVGASASGFISKIRVVREVVGKEMESHLFLWVPPERADWYNKPPESILGVTCSIRFPSILQECEEASKSYATGRFTACAFHLMRVTEAGVRALGLAIGFSIKNENWGRILKEFQRQQALDNPKKPPFWNGRFKKLHTIGANLQAVNHGWRNRIAHLDMVYTEERAKHLLTVIPNFVSDMSETIDENGKFY